MSASISGPPASSNPTHEILVRGVNWLGDAVMTVPALLCLRESFPQARITLLTPAKLGQLWDHHPAVDSVLTFTPGETPLRVALRLRSARFDLAIVLPNSPRSALETWLAGIPRRVGYARPWRNWFLTELVSPRAEAVPMRKRSAREVRRVVGGNARSGPPTRVPGPAAHQIYDHIRLATAVGAQAELFAPRLMVLPREAEEVAAKFGLAKPAAATGPLLGLNPGAEYGPAKRWPAERFVAVARALQAQAHATWLILGGPADTRLAASIEAALRADGQEGGSGGSLIKNLCGKTNLRELMALLTRCRLLLTNDTGPMHLAAALGTPVVALFGSTAPELTGPGLPGDSMHRLLQSRPPCAPCFRRTCPLDFRCMTGISVEHVVQEILQLLVL
jgi:heptosyltransferase-2